MAGASFQDTFRQYFKHEPNADQDALMRDLESFLRAKNEHPLFVLTGYAGTGKTAVVAALVKTLVSYKVSIKLMAPTGRAAKVLGKGAGHDAYTIHKQIYRSKSSSDPYSTMELAPNLSKNTIFIVDECSMIGDYAPGNEGGVGPRNLLEDLFEYVYSSPGCKMILLGDEGQLPPVGLDYSPALDHGYLNDHFPKCTLFSFRLTTVVRQAADSGILYNATVLRSSEPGNYPQLQIAGRTDIVRIEGGVLQEALEESYNRFGVEETMIITRSNKHANSYNLQIRGRILWYEEELCVHDLLMVVKNNYYWMDPKSMMGFIANGEVLQIVRIMRTEEMYGCRFARVLVRFPDYEAIGELEVMLNLEALQVEAPALPRERIKALFFAVEQDYLHIKIKKERYEAVMRDPYFNALQVKYAYAVTCHKSQGGQWHDVYVDNGYLTEDMLGADYNRWLYTAITRSYGRLFLVNFNDAFFSDMP